MRTMGQATSGGWDKLRSTRWKPPVPALSTPDRRRTYVSALQQAEELFRAAEVTGPAAAPLTLFYGLSQAGRAIAAAAVGIGEIDDSWKLNGHGIKTRAMEAPFPEVEIRTDKEADQGSFTRLSKLLNSPTWGNTPVHLSALWDCLPEAIDTPIGEDERQRRTPIVVVPDGHPDPHPLATATLNFLPAWVAEATDTRRALDAYLQAYPDAADYDSYVRSSTAPDAGPAFAENGNGRFYITAHWTSPDSDAGGPERRAYLRSLTRTYDGHHLFIPAVAGAPRGIHPLMAWWAVLHALSMLARYQPAQWDQHTDVDSSRYAVPIEGVLTAAIDVVPRLVGEAIDEVSSRPQACPSAEPAEENGLLPEGTIPTAAPATATGHPASTSA
ncbi:YaaC family protein [Kitasatospora purpeofusca]|uniref:YaaC family protein n=1 Tax=Kitasatospora purpeofusca TaxID=67352 RepID=UPI0035E3A3D3